MVKRKKKKTKDQKSKKENSSPVCFAKTDEVRPEFFEDEKPSK